MLKGRKTSGESGTQAAPVKPGGLTPTMVMTVLLGCQGEEVDDTIFSIRIPSQMRTCVSASHLNVARRPTGNSHRLAGK
jgi:hypothetical protein